MSLTAIVLVAISALMHAGWNLLTKSKHPSASFFLATSIFGVLLLSPVAIIYRDLLVCCIPTRVWTLLFITGFFMMVYYVSLAGAYASGDISVAYPLARSSPIIVVLTVTLILGRGAQVSTVCVLGIVLVVGGCFLVPMRRFTDLRIGNYLNATCGLALLAAVGTSGYSIIDDEALRLLRNTPELALGTTQVTLLYSCLEPLVSSLWLAVFVLARRKGRSNIRQVFRTHKRHVVLAGAAIHVTYLIVLVSLAFARNVSYVVAFRQLSIPLGTAFGIIVLKEPAHMPKLVGVGIMFVGLILVAIG